MTNIQLYTGETNGYSDEQIAALNKPLDPRLISSRKGASGTPLKYIAGHTAIDQANRIFGHGNWAFRPLSCEQVVLQDPLTGEAVGIEYKAMVELTVRGAIGPIVDIGSQPVASWNVEDQIMGRRVNDAKYAKPPRAVDEGPFTLLEKKSARAVIVEAHEAAKKGAVTDALKRALRAYGDAFGNGLYGDGHVDVSDTNTSAKPLSPLGAAITRAKETGFITGNDSAKLKASWEEQIIQIFGSLLPDAQLKEQGNLDIINGFIDEHVQKNSAGGGR